MLFRSSNADFSDTAMPVPVLYKRGFPASGLLGLYLFGEVDAGDNNPGPYLDLSGNNNHATRAATRAVPVQRSYGLEIADQYGFYMSCPFAQPASWTVVAGILANAQTGTQEVHILSNSGNGTPATATDFWSQSPWPTLSLPVGSDTAIRAYSGTGDFSDSSAQSTVPLALASGKRGQSIIPAMSVNGSDGRVRVSAKSGQIASVTTAKMIARQANTAPSNVFLGLMNFVSRFPVTGQVYGFSYYNRELSTEELAIAVGAMNAVMVERGLTTV